MVLSPFIKPLVEDEDGRSVSSEIGLEDTVRPCRKSTACLKV